jgi:PAS domain S-box-containing protein
MTVTGSILIVDDSEANRYAMARVLRQAGYAVTEAGTGTDALEMVGRIRPDLVVLDVKLPDVSGHEVCRRIKDDPATATVLVLQVSATFVKSRDAVRSLDAGADSYLTEPIEPPVLVATVRALLRVRRAEEALRDSEARHRILFEQNPLPAWVVEPGSLGVLAANEAALAHYGYTLGEFQAMGLGALHPEEGAKAFGERAQAGPSGRLGIWRHVKKDGSEVDADITMASLVLDHRQAWLVIATDVTERRRVELARAEILARERAARAQAEAANRAKDEFLATLSHELRTPLNAIYGWARVLRGDVDRPILVQGLDAIERNTRIQVKLIEDLLDVSRIITGKLTIDRRPVDLGEVAEATAETLRGSAEAKGVALAVQARRGTVIVEGDFARLQQIAANLGSNALKFTDAGGRVVVRVEAGDGAARLIVSDTGKGISPEFLPYVFERFSQQDSSTTRSYSGLGIGLAIVRHLVELHGGKVRAESDGEGHGAAFTVTLPLANRALAPAGTSPESSGTVRLEGLHVLVVDDDADSLDLTALLLRDGGARVTTARNAMEALSALELAAPDVMVSDLAMPGIDGYELMRRVRARDGAPLPALALTAHAMEGEVGRALDAGFRMHLGKPVDALALRAAVSRLAAGG